MSDGKPVLGEEADHEDVGHGRVVMDRERFYRAPQNDNEMTHRWKWCVIVATLGFGQAACMRHTKVPIPSVHYSTDAPRSCCLLVMLPGRGDTARAYRTHGFVNAVRDAGLDVDMVAVDAHLGYYSERTIKDRLLADVLMPARVQGYERIWLVGISLGGLGALLTARSHPEYVDGVILIGPYLGSRPTLTAIRAAGGALDWSPPEHPSWEESLWAWLGEYGRPDSDRVLPAIYLAYGEKDRHSLGQRLLAGLLPSSHVFVESGGHAWPVWRTLWDRMLHASVAGRMATLSSRAARVEP